MIVTNDLLPRARGPLACVVPVALALGFTVAPCGDARAQDVAELKAKLEALERQVQELKGELEKVTQKTAEVDAKAEALAAQQEAGNGGGSAPGVFATNAGKSTSPLEPASYDSQTGQVSVFGYGEINYNRPRDSSQSQVNVRRAVLGFGYRFNERLRMVSEFEFENAVTSADDSGEVAVEQLYLDYKVAGKANLKAGLFLMPIGLLNEVHEPTRYFGVERNDVETRIIPTTWREVGVGLYGLFDNGVYYDVGVTSGYNMHKWDGTEGPGAPLATIHQEGAQAAAKNLGAYAALRYLGIPGLRLGAGIWSGNSTQGNGPFKAGTSSLDLSGINGRITLWDTHAVWQPGRWDLRALYARGTIAQAGRIDDVLVAPAVGFTSGFVPMTFDGWYVQSAYTIWEHGDFVLKPFVRYERFNTQRTMPQGYESFTDPNLAERVVTAGASFFITPNAVIKADYQRYRADTDRSRLNVGLGYNF